MKRWTAITVATALTACQSAPQLAPDTRLKAYENIVITRMHAVWDRIASNRSDSLGFGTARVQFKVLPDGHVSDLKVVSNSGNQALADAGILTVQQTYIPPIPRAALAELPHGYDPGDISFTTSIRR